MKLTIIKFVTTIMNLLESKIDRRMSRLALPAVAIPMMLLGGLVSSASAQAVSRIDVRLTTCNRDGAGTDAKVWLGLGGREFDLDNPTKDDRERSDAETYTLGTNTNVTNNLYNDPRTPLQLNFIDLTDYPIYIRMSDNGSFPADDWCVEEVEVTAYYGASRVFRRLVRVNSSSDPFVWLAPNKGLILYLPN